MGLIGTITKVCSVLVSCIIQIPYLGSSLGVIFVLERPAVSLPYI
jgi:hypothetical protein